MMDTLEFKKDKLANLQREFDKTRQQLTEEINICEALAKDGLSPKFVHFSELYGRELSVSFDVKNREELLATLRSLPQPERLIKTTGTTFTSFKALVHLESLPEEKRKDDEEEVFPYRIQLDANSYGQTFEIEFNAPLEGKLTTFSIRAPMHIYRNHFGIEAKRKEYRGGFAYEDVRPYFSDKTWQLDDAATGVGNHIKWASGGPEYINKFTVYYSLNVEPPVRDSREMFANFLEKLP